MAGTDAFSVEMQLADGQLGIVAPDGSQAVGFIFTSTAGTANAVVPLSGTDTDAVIVNFGAGDGPDWVGDYLLTSGGKNAYAVRGTASTAGANGTATLLSGTGPTVPTFGGAPNEDADVRIKIITTGSQTTATYQLSLNGGESYGPTKTVGAALAMGQGSTVTFPTATYTAGAVFGATFTGPRNTLSNVTAAADALIASEYRFGAIHVFGAPDDAAALATLIAALDAKAEAARLVGKFFVFFVEAPAVDPALISAAIDSIVAPNVVVVGGYARVYDQNDRQVEKTSNARKIIGRFARNPLSVSLKRTVDDSTLDPLYADAKAIEPAGAAGTGADGYVNTAKLPGLRTSRCTTVCTIPGRGGAYVDRSLTLAALNSDFLDLPNRRIANSGLEVLYDEGWERAEQRIPRDPTTGFIDETTAKTWEKAAKAKLRTRLVEGGHATRVSVVINRNDNLASDPVVRMKARAVCVTRAGKIVVNFGFAVAIAA